MPERRSSSLMQALAENHKFLEAQNVYVEDKPVDRLPDEHNIAIIEGVPVTVFCSSGYLGVQKDRRVIEAAQKALDQYGIDTTMSRFVGGNTELLVGLETQLAEFKNTEAAVVFATGLLANHGAIPALTDAAYITHRFYDGPIPPQNGLIIGDHQNHQSLRDAYRLSHAPHLHYPHKDMTTLEKLLDQNQDKQTLVVTDGIFSIGGDLAPLPEIVALCKHYEAALYVDDAHGTGVFGPNGKGTADHFNLPSGDIDIHMGTLSKAVGIIGGFVASKKEVITSIKNGASGFIFTSSLTATEAAAISAALEIISEEPQRRHQLWRNVHRTISGLQAVGLPFPLQWSPIIPITIGNPSTALKVEQFLRKRQILCKAVVAHGVAPEDSCIRVLINANHSQQQIDQLLNSLDEAVELFQIPLQPISADTWDDFMKKSPNYLKQAMDLSY